MSSLDSLIVTAVALAMALSPIVLGSWLTARDAARAVREEADLEPMAGGAE